MDSVCLHSLLRDPRSILVGEPGDVANVETRHNEHDKPPRAFSRGGTAPVAKGSLGSVFICSLGKAEEVLEVSSLFSLGNLWREWRGRVPCISLPQSSDRGYRFFP